MKKKIFALLGIGLFILGVSMSVQMESKSTNVTLKSVEGVAACENDPANNNGHCVDNNKGDTFCARPEGQTRDCVQ